MYVTDKYVFVHCNKTGGVFVKDFLIKYFNAKVHRYKHSPIRMLDSKHRDKVKIGVIRNPFSWYVSYFTYLTKNGVLTTMDFPQFLFTYTEHPRALFDFMGKKIRRKFENLYPPKTHLNIGSWYFHFINYFCYDAIKIFNPQGSYAKCEDYHDLDVLMRTENLKEDMIKTFGEEHRESIENLPKKNVSNTKPYQEYYTPALRERVEQKDGILMEYLGYEF